MPDFPSNWARAPLRDFAETSSGGTPSRARPRYYGGPIPWVKSGELGDGLITKTEESITQEALANSSAKIFPKGTLCIALYGATVGRLGILGHDAATNQAVCGIFLRGGISPKYLFYFFQMKRPELISISQGGAQPNISQAIVRSVEVAFAPTAEQDRIVAEIEKQFTRLDDAVKALKRVQANLKRYRASVLKAACEGRLVPTEAELARKEGRDYEPASELLKRILAERRARWEAYQLQKMIAAGKPPKDDQWKQRYRQPTVADKSELPALPKGWVWASIDQVTECLDGQRIPVNKEDRAKRRGETPYYGANGRVGWIDGFLFDEALVLVVEDETFVGRTIPFAYMISGKSWVNNHAHVLRASRAVLPVYLNYSLMFYPFTPLTTGSTGRRKLTQKALMSAPYALPPKNEQTRIVAEIERLTSMVDNAISIADVGNQRAAALRSGILRKAFSGKLVLQDSDDEPASVLLERIRAERVALALKKENQSAKTKSGTVNGQRRRRVEKLAPGASPGKTSKQKTSTVGAAQRTS
jgi:type I restriction enzyme S subunit